MHASARFSGSSDPRAVLKSSARASGQAHDLVEATTPSVAEGWNGAVPLARLAPRPGALLSLHRSAQNPEPGDGDRVAHPALVLPGAHVQRVMRAVFKAPIQTNPFPQAGRIGWVGRQAGNAPDGFDFWFTPLELAKAVQACQRDDLRKTHLFRGDLLDLEAAPLEAPGARVERHHLGGKSPPAGGVWLGRAGWAGCP